MHIRLMIVVSFTTLTVFGSFLLAQQEPSSQSKPKPEDTEVWQPVLTSSLRVLRVELHLLTPSFCLMGKI
jgi:hypothetical protein